MIRKLIQILSDLKKQRITQTRIREAYLQADSKYLKKAYKHGRAYLKRTAVNYLGEIATQDNFDFLLYNMVETKDIQLKSYLYLAICNILSNGNIQVDKDISDFLNNNIALLDNIGVVNYKPQKQASKPILFIKKDYLKMLEDMREQFSSLG